MAGDITLHRDTPIGFEQFCKELDELERKAHAENRAVLLDDEESPVKPKSKTDHEFA